MVARLYVIQDDLFFSERVRATAQRLKLEPIFITPAEATTRVWETGSVVALQLTLNPERQLALLERLRQAEPSPRVVAVSGHLETELRRRARSLGATLAAHSSMERVLVRACQVSGGGGDAGDDRKRPK